MRSSRAPLACAADDARIWRNTPLGPSFDDYFDRVLALRQAGAQIPFAVRWLASGALVGGSRFLDIVPEHRRVEIGGTWYHPDHWGGPTNPEAKLLLLRVLVEITLPSRAPIQPTWQRCSSVG